MASEQPFAGDPPDVRAGDHVQVRDASDRWHPRVAMGSASYDGMTTPDTMTVTVRDQSAEAPWGSGLTNPVTRTVTISALCQVPGCGTRRGEPRGHNSCDDGAYYWVQVWDNPCGHVDRYEDVIAEAKRLNIGRVTL
jgi:hypothetical protein